MLSSSSQGHSEQAIVGHHPVGVPGKGGQLSQASATTIELLCMLLPSLGMTNDTVGRAGLVVYWRGREWH